ncbi:MAG: YdcF family protein [Sphingomicrobium sp.]
MRDYIIVFGAAVRANGKPSLVLRRRINRAAAWARAHPDAMIMPTGGTGEHGPAEAAVMKQALVQAGIATRRIVPECEGRDTLESIRLCDRLLRERGDCARVVVRTSRYHQPRCALLFRLLGWTALAPKSGRSTGRLKDDRARSPRSPLRRYPSARPSAIQTRLTIASLQSSSL